MAEPVMYWEEAEEGQEIPTFVWQTDLMYWNRYAAVGLDHRVGHPTPLEPLPLLGAVD